MKHRGKVNAKQDDDEDDEYEYEYDSETQGNVDQSTQKLPSPESLMKRGTPTNLLPGQ